MIVIGIIAILASLAWGAMVIIAYGMADAHETPTWADFWPMWLGIAVGALFIASKWLP